MIADRIARQMTGKWIVGETGEAFLLKGNLISTTADIS